MIAHPLHQGCCTRGLATPAASDPACAADQLPAAYCEHDWLLHQGCHPAQLKAVLPGTSACRRVWLQTAAAAAWLHERTAAEPGACQVRSSITAAQLAGLRQTTSRLAAYAAAT